MELEKAKNYGNTICQLAKRDSGTDRRFNEVTAMPDNSNKYDSRIWG